MCVILFSPIIHSTHTQSSEHEVERTVEHELQADSNLLQLVNVTPKKIVASSSKQVKRLCLITTTKIPWSKKVKVQLSSTPKHGVKRPVQANTPQNWQSRKKPKKKSKLRPAADLQ